MIESVHGESQEVFLMHLIENDHSAPVPLTMRSRNALIALAISFSVAISSTAFAAVKPGSACSKLGSTSVLKGIKYSCIKSGKKLVWNKGILIPVPKVTPSPVPTPTTSASPSPAPSPSATPTPTSTATPTPTTEPVVLPTSFEDLFERRTGIETSAFNQVAKQLEKGVSKLGPFEVITGPNSVPHIKVYEDAPHLISRLFSNFKEPEKVLVIQFNYQDQDWALETLKKKLSASDYAQVLIWDPTPVSGNCDVKTLNCRGARQITAPSGYAFILQGIATLPIPASDAPRIYSGMKEAHEYLHSLQRMPMIAPGAHSNMQDWPPGWFREGSADWVSNALVYSKDFESFHKFKRGQIDWLANYSPDFSLAFVEKYLDVLNYRNYWADFDPGIDYALGGYVVESLVALKGPDVMLSLYVEMSKGIGFESAFKNIFNADWKTISPILAKTVYANIKEGR